MVFHGHAPLKYVVRCQPFSSAIRWNVDSSWYAWLSPISATRGASAASDPNSHETGRASLSCTKHCSSLGRSTPAKPGAGRIVSPKSVPAQASSSTIAAPKQSGGFSRSSWIARTPSVYAGALTAHAIPAVPADHEHRGERRPQRHARRPRGQHLPAAGRILDEALGEPGEHEADQQQGDAVVDREAPERHRRRDDDERPVPEVQRVRDVPDELRGADREEPRRVPPSVRVGCRDHGGRGQRRDRGHVAGERRLAVEAEDHDHQHDDPAPSRAGSCRSRCGSAAREPARPSRRRRTATCART